MRGERSRPPPCASIDTHRKLNPSGRSVENFLVVGRRNNTLCAIREYKRGSKKRTSRTVSRLDRAWVFIPLQLFSNIRVGGKNIAWKIPIPPTRFTRYYTAREINRGFRCGRDLFVKNVNVPRQQMTRVFSRISSQRQTDDTRIGIVFPGF